jgi:lactonase family protein with 7-bladed beta-propeller
MTPDAGQSGKTAAEGVLYLISNTVGDKANTVLGFQRVTSANVGGGPGNPFPIGSLATLPNSPFPLGGSGGPATDANQQLIVSADHRYLFAVNPGSDSVAVMQIHVDGGLEPVFASPFDSNGPNPVSLALDGKNHLFVINQDENPSSPNAALPPSYSPFSIGDTGLLARIPGLRFIAQEGSSPNQAVLSSDGGLLFGAEELNPLLSPPLGPLRSFHVGDDGALLQASGSPTSVPYAKMTAPRVVGIAAHPKAPFLYASYWVRNEIAVFRYDAASADLVFVHSIVTTGNAIKSMLFSRDGTRLYGASSIGGTVVTFDTSIPEMPNELQKVTVRPPTGSEGHNPAIDLRAMALDPGEKFLYVVDNWSDDEARLRDNSIHTFDVAADGKISETQFSDTRLLLPGTRAIGLVVL